MKCIYSLKINMESNREHIIPAFLGGKECLPVGWVSKEVNDKFSKIEAACSLYPMFSLMREFVGPGKRGGNSKPTFKKYHVVIGDNSYSIGYVFDSKPHVITDIRIDTENNILIFEGDLSDIQQLRINYIKIKDFFSDTNNKYISLVDKNIPQNIVILGVDNDKKIIAINDKVCFDNLLPKIKKIVSNLNVTDFSNFKQKEIQPEMLSGDTIYLDILYRFLAKIVFNVAAKINGYDKILSPQFNAIRNAILTGSGIEKYVSDCNNKLPLNECFEKLEGISFDEETCHLICLKRIENEYYGYISMYGTKRQYKIKLIENIKEGFYPVNNLYVCDWKNGFEGSLVDIAFKYCLLCDKMEQNRDGEK